LITNLDTAQTGAAQLPYVENSDSIILLQPLRSRTAIMTAIGSVKVRPIS
jgi:hypothetical protein